MHSTNIVWKKQGTNEYIVWYYLHIVQNQAKWHYLFRMTVTTAVDSRSGSYQLVEAGCEIFRNLLTTGNLKFAIIYSMKIRKLYKSELLSHFFSKEQVVKHLPAYYWVRGKRAFGIITSFYFYTGWWLNRFSL